MPTPNPRPDSEALPDPSDGRAQPARAAEVGPLRVLGLVLLIFLIRTGLRRFQEADQRRRATQDQALEGPSRRSNPKGGGAPIVVRGHR
jgi:hypothetical protein